MNIDAKILKKIQGNQIKQHIKGLYIMTKEVLFLKCKDDSTYENSIDQERQETQPANPPVVLVLVLVPGSLLPVPWPPASLSYLPLRALAISLWMRLRQREAMST